MGAWADYARPVDSGSWADWVNAVGTYLAVAGAAFAGVVALRSYRSQKAATDRQLEVYAGDEKRRIEHARQQQASKVAMWIFRGRFGWAVQWVNDGGLPIFRTIVHIQSKDPSFSVALERGTQGPQGPSTSKKMSNALCYILEQHRATDMNPADVTLAIAFTDMAGVRWPRDNDGSLREVDTTFDFGDVAERIVDRDVPREIEWDGPE